MVLSSQRPIRYAITALSSFPSDVPAERRLRLQTQLRRWAVDGVDFVQLREKELKAGDLLTLARTAVETLQQFPRRPRLLVNGRVDVVLAAGADGVHLSTQSGALDAAQVQSVFAGAGRPGLISTSCHTLTEVADAHRKGAGLILFGPVFEKRVDGEVVVAGGGLQLLRQACRTAEGTPVLALGGVTPGRVAACLHAGADGVAAIRLFS